MVEKLSGGRPLIVFSLDAYHDLLRLAHEKGWKVAAYPEKGSLGPRQILLRHDVDYSVEIALEMARANAALGVHGTFFLLLRSDLYNLWSPRNQELARQIQAAGQSVGLHFAALQPVPPNEASLARMVKREFELLREVVPGAAPVFAWHNPTTAWLDRFGKLEVEGLINAYAPRFTVAMRYRSDSNLRHSPDDFARLLQSEDASPLHLLFHPLNWVVGGRDMIEILAGTWGRLLREQERDFRTNRVYQQQLPHGMPAPVVEQFVRRWEAAARAA
jgi:hypothetical protein